jgi:hypothetical protein
MRNIVSAVYSREFLVGILTFLRKKYYEFGRPDCIGPLIDFEDAWEFVEFRTHYESIYLWLQAKCPDQEMSDAVQYFRAVLPRGIIRSSALSTNLCKPKPRKIWDTFGYVSYDEFGMASPELYEETFIVDSTRPMIGFPLPHCDESVQLPVSDGRNCAMECLSPVKYTVSNSLAVKEYIVPPAPPPSPVQSSPKSFLFTPLEKQKRKKKEKMKVEGKIHNTRSQNKRGAEKPCHGNEY